jgi:hypothetical protein
MRSYERGNAPRLDGRAPTIYRAIVAGEPVVVARSTCTPDDLHLVAERIACDDAVGRLQAMWVDARISSVQGVAVAVYPEDFDSTVLDARSASDLAHRMESGLSLRKALQQTLDQCASAASDLHIAPVLRRTLRDGSRS